MQPGVTRREMPGGGRRVTMNPGVRIRSDGGIVGRAGWSSGERGRRR